MGLSISTLFDHLLTSLSRKKEYRILMLGLDAAGKTTVLYKLQLGDIVSTIPTIGFNVETVQYKNVSMTVYDVGGQDRLRPLWRHYYSGTQGLIFVVDSNDSSRLEEASKELHKLLADDAMQESVVLIYANKQDLPNAVKASDMCDRLRLQQVRHSWYIQPCSATNSEGLYEGLEWLTQALSKQP